MNILTKILHAGIFERAVSPPATPVGMGLRRNMYCTVKKL